MPDGSAPLFPMRQPPCNIAAEQAYLGALIANGPRVASLSDFLKTEHFYDPIHAAIFSRAIERINAGQLADAITLHRDFENSGILDEVGGTDYLPQLMSAMVPVNIAGDYARVIRDDFIRRQLIEAGQEIVNRSFIPEQGVDALKLAEEAAETVLRVGSGMAADRGAEFAAVARNAPARAEAVHKRAPGRAPLDTGLPEVDRLWQGLYPSELYFLMARSRTGKTAFMSQVVRNVARQLLAEAEARNRAPEHVHVFSLEMDAEAYVSTNLASMTRWSADQIKRGEIGDAKSWVEFQAAADDLARLPIIVDDTAGLDLAGLRMRAMAVKRQKNTRLICIDYRELIQRGRDEMRMQDPAWMPFLGNSLKILAKTLKVPVLALTQINKATDKQAVPRPTLGDIPYDGGQAADSVFALFRPELYMSHDPPATMAGTSAEKAANARSAWENERKAVRNLAEFGALKRRFGPANDWAKLRFDGPRLSFQPWVDEDKMPDLLDSNDYPMSEADYGR